MFKTSCVRVRMGGGESSFDTSEKQVFPWTWTCSVTDFSLLLDKQAKLFSKADPLRVGHSPRLHHCPSHMKPKQFKNPFERVLLTKSKNVILRRFKKAFEKKLFRSWIFLSEDNELWLSCLATEFAISSNWDISDFRVGNMQRCKQLIEALLFTKFTNHFSVSNKLWEGIKPIRLMHSISWRSVFTFRYTGIPDNRLTKVLFIFEESVPWPWNSVPWGKMSYLNKFYRWNWLIDFRNVSQLACSWGFWQTCGTALLIAPVFLVIA